MFLKSAGVMSMSSTTFGSAIFAFSFVVELVPVPPHATKTTAVTRATRAATHACHSKEPPAPARALRSGDRPWEILGELVNEITLRECEQVQVVDEGGLVAVP